MLRQISFFDLNKRDSLYPIVIKLLRGHRSKEIDLAVSSAAPLDVSLVLLSRGFSLDTIAIAATADFTLLTSDRIMEKVLNNIFLKLSSVERLV